MLKMDHLDSVSQRLLMTLQWSTEKKSLRIVARVHSYFLYMRIQWDPEINQEKISKQKYA